MPLRGRIARFVLICIIIVELLFCSGILYGFTSLRLVYFKLGVYSYLCKQSDNNTTISDSESVVFTNGTSIISIDKNAQRPCRKQDDRYSNIFIIWTVAQSVVTIFVGIFFDNFGLRISKLTGAVVFCIGCLCYGFTSEEIPHFLIAAGCLLAVSSQFIMLSNLQSSQIYPKLQNFIVSICSGSFDSSCIVFALIRLGFHAGIPIYWSFTLLGLGGLALMVFTSLLMMTKNTEDMKLLAAKCKPEGGNDETDMEGTEFCQLKKDEAHANPVTAGDVNGNTSGDGEVLVDDKNDEEVDKCKSAEDRVSFLGSKNAIYSPQSDLDIKYPTLRSCIVSRFYIGHVLYFSCQLLRFSFFLTGIAQLITTRFKPEQDVINRILSKLDYFLFAGILVAPFAGVLTDSIIACLSTPRDLSPEQHYWVKLRPLIAPLLVTNTASTLLSLLVFSSSEWVMYLAFATLVVFRGFLFSTQATSLLMAFPIRFFGRLFGVAFIISGAFAILQYPILNLGKLNLEVANSLLLVISLIGFIQPIQIVIGVRCIRDI